MKSVQLIDECIADTNLVIEFVSSMRNQDLDSLRWQPNEDSWSMIACIEHLNLYGYFYLPEIERAVQKTTSTSVAEFRSGILGGYFSKMMLPDSQMKKMKTFANKNPRQAILDKQVLEVCIDQQLKLLALLRASMHVNLNEVRIPTTISRWLRLKLGDVFRFVINHNLRHLQQIRRIQQAQIEQHIFVKEI
jgi:hypothetical protein